MQDYIFRSLLKFKYFVQNIQFYQTKEASNEQTTPWDQMSVSNKQCKRTVVCIGVKLSTHKYSITPAQLLISFLKKF